MHLSPVFCHLLTQQIQLHMRATRTILPSNLLFVCPFKILMQATLPHHLLIGPLLLMANGDLRQPWSPRVIVGACGSRFLCGAVLAISFTVPVETSSRMYAMPSFVHAGLLFVGLLLAAAILISVLRL
jgi:hypothetical protein